MGLWGRSAKPVEGVDAAATDEGARRPAEEAKDTTTAAEDDDGFANFLKTLICLEDAPADETAGDDGSDGGLDELERTLGALKCDADADAAGEEESQEDGGLAAFERALASPDPLPRASPRRTAAFVGSNNGTDFTDNNAGAAAVWRDILANMNKSAQNDTDSAKKAKLAQALGPSVQIPETIELANLPAEPPAWLVQQWDEETKPTALGCLRYWLGAGEGRKEEEEAKEEEAGRTRVRVVKVEAVGRAAGMEGRA